MLHFGVGLGIMVKACTINPQASLLHFLNGTFMMKVCYAKTELLCGTGHRGENVHQSTGLAAKTALLELR